MQLTAAHLSGRRVLAGGGLSLTKVTLVVLAASCSPASSAEPQSFAVTVVEQTRYDITVAANEEYAARTDALLEARRTSGSCKPWWEPSPPTVISHAREAADFAVIKVEPLVPTRGTRGRGALSFGEEHAEAAAKALQAEWRREDTSAATGTRGLLP